MTLARALDRVAAIWSRPKRPLAEVCAVALILAIAGVAAAAGAVHTRIFGHDIFIPLDAGWRVLNGQRPDLDFSPSMGPLFGLFAAAGLWLARDSVDGIAYMSAMVGALAGLWAYGLGRRRLAAAPAALAAALLALIAAAPFPIGFAPNLFSHAMLYNRFGYALLGVVALECLGPGQRTAAGAVSTGILCAALLFLKPSYSLVAVSFAAATITRRRAVLIPVGGLAAGLAMMAYLRGDFSAVWNDLHLLSQARGAGLTWWTIRWSFAKGFSELLPLALLALLVSSTTTVRPLMITALAFTGGALLLATNAQPAGYPLNALLAILVAEHGRAGRATAPAIFVLLALVCYAPVFLSNATGLALSAIDARRDAPLVKTARFDAPPLANLLFFDVPDGTDADQRSNGRVYVDYLNDGLDLIRRASKPYETIFTLDMVNPFPFALLRRPARGGSPALSFNHTFNDQHKPSPDALFGSADLVMAPKRPASSEPEARALFRNYLGSIESGFRLCAQSGWWKLYKRPNRLQGCPAISER